MDDIFAFRTSGEDIPKPSYKVRVTESDWMPSDIGGEMRYRHLSLVFSVPLFGEKPGQRQPDQKYMTYKIALQPSHFFAVAKEMMKVNAQEAIRAFGIALQDFQIIDDPNGK